MFTDLNVIKTAYAMAVHAGERQSIVAQNIANADTPGYTARDLKPFADTFKSQGTASGMTATRAGHIGYGPGHSGHEETRIAGHIDPNGNGVSVELEMVKAVETKRQHDRAIAIYRSSMNILRTSISQN